MSSIGSVGSFETEEREELLSAPPQFAPPQLQAPRDTLLGDPRYGLIGAKLAEEKQTGRILGNYIEEEKREGPEIERHAAAKKEALDQYAREVKSRKTWSIFGKVAQYVTAAVSIAVGIACMATGVGSAPGALLIASGGLALANCIMSDTGGWKAVASWFTKSEELQVKWARILDTSVFFIAAGLGIAGGIWAYKAGALGAAAAGTTASKIKNITTGVGFVGTVIQGGARIGEATIERKIGNLTMRMKEEEGSMTLLYHGSSEGAKRVEGSLEGSQSTTDGIQRGLDGSRVNL